MKTILAILFFCVVATLANPSTRNVDSNDADPTETVATLTSVVLEDSIVDITLKKDTFALSPLLSLADAPPDWTVSRPDSSPNDVSITEAAVDSKSNVTLFI